MSQNYRPTTVEGLEPKIDDQLELICRMAAMLHIPTTTNLSLNNIEYVVAVRTAYAIFDEAVKQQNERRNLLLDKETRRRRGF